MESAERSWHEKLAQRITSSQHVISNGEQQLVLYRYQLGHRLNRVFRFDHIPFLDMEEITTIYNVGSATINRSRRFAAYVRDERHARQLASEYGNWTAVQRGFLNGLTSDETQKALKATSDRQNGKSRSRRHLANVADSLRDSLIDKGGLSLDEAADAIRLFLANARWQDVKATWEKRADLRAWRDMHK